MMTGPANARRIRILPALVGFVVGTVIVSSAALLAWNARILPRHHPRPIEFSVQTLPEKVVGAERTDLELRRLPPSSGHLEQIASIDDLNVAQQPSFVGAYGGTGIEVSYGWVAGQSITVTAVNGVINPEIAVSPREIESITGLSSSQPIAADGTPGTSCTYQAGNMVYLESGQTGEQLIAQVLADQANGNFQCVRRDLERDLSVKIQRGVSPEEAKGRTASQIAVETAAETDRIWESLD